MSVITTTELSHSDLITAMGKIPLKRRNIGQFCGYYIYDNECNNENCNRMHTQNLDDIRFYLEDPKVKSVLCEKGAHCKHFLCRFGHDFDYIIFGKNSDTPPCLTKFEYSTEDRNIARQNWRDAKHFAFSQELMDGSRKPKNKYEEDLLATLQEQTVSNNKENFPPLSSNINIEDEKDVGMISTDIPVYNPVNTDDAYYEAVVDVNQKFNGIFSYFQNNPNYLNDPIVSQLYQVAYRQNYLLNSTDQ